MGHGCIYYVSFTVFYYALVRPMGVSSRRPTLERQHSMERHPGNESLVSEYEKSLDLPYAVPDHIVSTPTSRSSFLHSSLSADDSVFGPPKAPTQSFDSPSSDSGSIPPSQPHTSSEIRNFGESCRFAKPIDDLLFICYVCGVVLFGPPIS